ncbi:MAG: hydroxymethylbilane synthase [Planctomycetes bacterium]|nr:hydroxymethylbilane synthase [Planctomycetota bacterium]
MVLLRIATRGSPLALWQANHVAELLRAHEPELRVEFVQIQTAGDRVRDVPLGQIGGEGVFTKAIQDAVLEGRAELAVHSLKDLPTFTALGLVLAAVPPRGPFGDALISKSGHRLADLRQGAVVATSSIRRRAQLLHRRPDLSVIDMRGNVETRLRKLEDDAILAAIVLAQAGLERLALAGKITEILDVSWMLPAVGQGAIGVECRHDDNGTLELLARIDDPLTHAAVAAERAFLRVLGGGCQMPIGALARCEDGHMHLRGVVLTPSGDWRVEGSLAGESAKAVAIGEDLAAALLTKGAREKLQS